MKAKTLIASAILLFAVFAQAARAQEEFKPITVFLTRHAEREDEPRQDPPLKKEGVVRSPTIDERKFDDLFIVTVYAKGKARVVQMKYGAE